MKSKTNKELSQTGDNLILFIIMAIGIVGIVAGYISFLFF